MSGYLSCLVVLFVLFAWFVGLIDRLACRKADCYGLSWYVVNLLASK